MAGISCRRVRVAYDGRSVLRDVEVSAGPGEWVAVIGPNGAGKSTLLRAVAGMVDAAGDIDIGDSSLARMSRRRRARSVAMVPQNPTIPPGMAVVDYVLLGRTPYLAFWAGESEEDVARVRAVLQRLELDDMAGRPLSHLSGGELQRAVLARALVQDATILLLDEPTTALDIGHQQHVLELVDELRRERQLAVLSAIHDLTLAAQYADRLVLLSDGVVVAAGTPEEVLTSKELTLRYGASVTILRDPAGGLVVAPRRVHDGQTATSKAEPTR